MGQFLNKYLKHFGIKMWQVKKFNRKRFPPLKCDKATMSWFKLMMLNQKIAEERSGLRETEFSKDWREVCMIRGHEEEIKAIK